MARDLISLIAPKAKVSAYAGELKEWAVGAGLVAATLIQIPEWSPPPERPLVRGLLPAVDPAVARRRNAEGRMTRSFSSELDLEV